MLKKIWPYGIFVGFCLIFTIWLMVFHHVTKDSPVIDGFNFTLYAHLYAVINYDSLQFMHDAAQPKALLERTNIRQSRPGLILLVAGLNKLAQPLRYPVDRLFRASGKEIQEAYRLPYVLYVGLNYAFLLIAFWIYMQVLAQEAKLAMLAAVLLSSLFIFNNVIKAFLLTPHTQIFNLLAPLVCLYGFQGIQKGHLFDQKAMLFLAFLVGLGVTAYATFILFLPTVFIALAWILIRDKIKITGGLVLRSVEVIGLAILPFLAWVFYIHNMNGMFYQFEIEHYHQFVWILPLLRSAPLDALKALSGNFWTLAKSAATQMVVLPVIFIGVCLVTSDRGHPLLQRLSRIKLFPPPALIVSMLFLLFFALDGLGVYRVAFSAVPPLVIGTSIVVNDLLRDATPLRRKLAIGSVAILVCMEWMFILSTVGPFS